MHVHLQDLNKYLAPAFLKDQSTYRTGIIAMYLKGLDFHLKLRKWMLAFDGVGFMQMLLWYPFKSTTKSFLMKKGQITWKRIFFTASVTDPRLYVYGRWQSSNLMNMDQLIFITPVLTFWENIAWNRQFFWLFYFAS